MHASSCMWWDIYIPQFYYFVELVSSYTCHWLRLTSCIYKYTTWCIKCAHLMINVIRMYWLFQYMICVLFCFRLILMNSIKMNKNNSSSLIVLNRGWQLLTIHRQEYSQSKCSIQLYIYWPVPLAILSVCTKSYLFTWCERLVICYDLHP